MGNNLEQCSLECYLGEKDLQKHWGGLLFLGIALVLLGILAVASANIVTLTSVIFLGFLLAIGGVLQFIYSFRLKKGQGFVQTLLSGLLYTVVGILFIIHPAVTALTITLLLALFYTVAGLFKIIVSLTTPVAQWGWLLFSGIVSLVLGILIWSEWPLTGLWFIGLLIGIDLIFVGWFWIMLSLKARSLSHQIKR